MNPALSWATDVEKERKRSYKIQCSQCGGRKSVCSVLVHLPLVLLAVDLLDTNVDVQLWVNQTLLSDTNSGAACCKIIFLSSGNDEFC